MFAVNSSWSWLKQIPLTATVAAAAAAALSLYTHDDSAPSGLFGGGSSHKGSGSRRTLTWSDEHGMSLTEIINPSQSLFPQSSSVHSVDADALKTICEDGDGASDASTNASDDGEATDGSNMGSVTDSFGVTLSEITLSEIDTQELKQMEADKLEAERESLLREAMDPVSPVSPQWGWYVSITPPQPHMYQETGTLTPGTPPRSLASR